MDSSGSGQGPMADSCEPMGFINGGKPLDQLRDYKIPKKETSSWSSQLQCGRWRKRVQVKNLHCYIHCC